MNTLKMPKFKSDIEKKLKKYFSCDLDFFFQIKICYLRIPTRLSHENYPDSWFFIECVVRNGESDLCTAIQTRQQPKTQQICVFNEPIVFPLKISDLKLNSNIFFKISHISPDLEIRQVKSGSFPIFNSEGQFYYHQREIFFEDSEYENIDDIKKKYSEIENYINNNFQHLPYYPWVEKLTNDHISLLSNKKDTDPPCMTLIVQFQEFPISPPFSILYLNPDVLKPIFAQESLAFNVPFDPGFNEINLVEEKHHFQVKNLSNTRKYFQIKPTSLIKDKLNKILKSPLIVPLSQDDKDNIWIYRHFLSENPEALAKFLLSIDWSNQSESKEATDLLKKWKKLIPSLALELLTTLYDNTLIKSYAISCLSLASEEELDLYLLNLVFALESDFSFSDSMHVEEIESEIFLNIQENVSDYQERIKNINLDDKNSSLLQFLLKRCSESDILANSFYWYMNLAAFDDGKRDKKPSHYKFMIKSFINILSDKFFVKRKIQIEKQGELLKNILKVSEKLKSTNTSRKSKILIFQNLLATESNFTDLDVSSPLYPYITLNKILPDKCYIFNSVQMPLKFCFQTNENKECSFIFKDGDDLRQDQVILTMIRIMNKILMKENIDLKLTPYRVLSISPNCGLIEYIPSISVAETLSKYGTIQAYFKSLSSNQDMIDPSILENYIKSCAGYSVLTYLFGVGDRHLDNILITPEGKLFHIDFAYIFSRDPKPYPPQIKLTTDMVDGMGGLNSSEFEYFLKLCTLAYIHLRLNSHSIINLFSMLVHSDFGEVSTEPDKVVLKLYEKFNLDLNDDEAQTHILNIIFESYKAVFAPFVEKIHQIAQKIRQ